MHITELSKEETHVLSGLAILGDAIIDREVFSEWVGGYAEAISSLIEGGWIQVHNCGVDEKLSMSTEKRDVVRNLSKQNTGGCGWVARLLDRIAYDLADQQETAKLKTGANSSIWYEPDAFERAK